MIAELAQAVDITNTIITHDSGFPRDQLSPFWKAYAKVGQALGAYGERIDSPNDVGPALRRGIKANQEGRTAVIEVMTKEEAAIPNPTVLG